jgi:cysteate synthase
MLNITGGGIGRFKSENEYIQIKPDLVFPVDADPEVIRERVAALF